MFIVERTVTKLVSNVVIHVQKVNCDTLYDALEQLKEFQLEDKARYECLQIKEPHYFFDSNCNDTSYHYTVGKCKISCEILDIEKDARAVFLIDIQEMEGKQYGINSTTYRGCM